jgi:hypothetical protein
MKALLFGGPGHGKIVEVDPFAVTFDYASSRTERGHFTDPVVHSYDAYTRRSLDYNGVTFEAFAHITASDQAAQALVVAHLHSMLIKIPLAKMPTPLDEDPLHAIDQPRDWQYGGTS